MLAPPIDPTVASVFAPRTRIEPDGTVEGYASLFGELARRRTAGKA
jgi:Escherichia/Staphylococcus phage prohead protease